MKYIQCVKWSNGDFRELEYYKRSQEEMIDMLKRDITRKHIIATWLKDKNGKELAYFDKHIQSITGEEELKKGTIEEVLLEINNKVFVSQPDIRSVLESLEKQGYIKFKKEPKKYKVFVKLVTIGEENKKLYYVNEHHLTDNIDEAKRFGLNEDKYGYAYEYVKEY
ncbi:MAG: hypothetical protein DBY24_02565 [Prevotellaceae bacterium]|nr:MAG: hypothetical protein DBY24_02565 [Prevotellaceae bacterium]